MNKALTEDEKFLLHYVKECNSQYELYKFYDSEEDIDERIPDVWNWLMDKLDAAEAKYNEARLAYANKDADSAYWYRIHVDACKETVDTINRLLELVENSDAKYFAFFSCDLELVPIVKKQHIVYKPILENGKLSFEDTGEKIAVWTPESRIGAYAYSLNDQSGKRIWVGSDCFNVHDYFVFFDGLPNQELLNKDTRIACVNCGRIFQFNSSEKNFYTRKGLEMPKRCPTCRNAKKTHKGDRHSSETSYFEEMMQYI